MFPDFIQHPDFSKESPADREPIPLDDLDELYGATQEELGCSWDGKNPVPCFKCRHKRYCMDAIPLDDNEKNI